MVRHDDVIVIDSDSDSDIELLPSETRSAGPGTSGEVTALVKGNAAKRRKIADGNITPTNAVASGSKLPPARTRAEIPQTRPQPIALVQSSSSIPRADKPTEWPCPVCTFANHPDLPTCEICLTERPTNPTKPTSISNAPKRRTSPVLLQAQTSTSISSKLNASKKPATPVDLDAWDCTTCGERGMDGNFWTCRFCGGIKLSS